MFVLISLIQHVIFKFVTCRASAILYLVLMQNVHENCGSYIFADYDIYKYNYIYILDIYIYIFYIYTHFARIFSEFL